MAERPWSQRTPEEYRQELLGIHEQERQQARGIYDRSGRQALIEAAYRRAQETEAGAGLAAVAGGAGERAALGQTTQGVLGATTEGLHGAQQERLAAMGNAMGVEAKRAGYELSVEESKLAQKGAEMASLDRIAAARAAAQQRTRQAMETYAGAAIGAGAAGLGMASGYMQNDQEGLSAYEQAQKKRADETYGQEGWY